MTRGLSYEDLAAAYELRHGYDKPTPWKWIAREYGLSADALQKAIHKLEHNGLNRDANGAKPRSRVTQISSVMLNDIKEARDSGMSWPAIAYTLKMPEGTVKSRYWRWRKAQKILRKMAILSHNE